MRSILVAAMLCAVTGVSAEVGPGTVKQTNPNPGAVEAGKSATEQKPGKRNSQAVDKALAEKAAAERAAAGKFDAEMALANRLPAESAAADQAKLEHFVGGAAAAAVVALVLALIFWRRAAALRARFAPIIDIEERVAQLQADEAKEGAAVAELRRSRVELESSVKALTEDLGVMDHGVYQPRFDFTTSEDYKRKLDDVYAQQRALVNGGTAAPCTTEWEVRGSRTEGQKMTTQRIKVMLRAFNGEVDAAVANVTWNNVKTMEERVLRSYEAVNKNGDVNCISFAHASLELALTELRLAYEYQRKKQDEKEEQRRIRKEMREEERVRRECEKTLANAEEALREAHGEEMALANAKVDELKALLAEALAKKERAIAQAQLTSMGHIYVISNIGSFGEHVYKIGMSRRLDPEERIRELGDPSVPFEFDIHAMIKAEDAPTLEKAFHQQLASRAVNLVNPRKEFFQVDLREVETFARSSGVAVEFTMLAEAREHRESQALRSNPQVAPPRDSTPVTAQLVN